jgi:hypothetical protein
MFMDLLPNGDTERLLDIAFPIETRATCRDCAMCSRTSEMRSTVRFREQVKCCSYWPLLPNYKVGAILRDETSAGADGRRRVEAMLERSWALPTGLGAAPAYRILYEASSAREFGRSELLRCPYMSGENGGECSIWSHRNSICATFFCKFVNGVAGRDFWNAFRLLGSLTEQALAAWCASELGIRPSSIRISHDQLRQRTLERESLDGYDRGGAPELWQSWHKRRRDFYVACASQVERLTFDDVRRIGGDEFELRLAELRQMHDRLVSGALPLRLSGRQVAVRSLQPETYTVISYLDTDPQIIDRPLLDALRECDALTPSEILGRLREAGCSSVDAAALRTLHDFGFLSESPPDAASS